MHPCGPGLCQPVQKTGVVALQFCGVSKADIQGSQAEREGPCRRRGEAVPIGAGVNTRAQNCIDRFSVAGEKNKLVATTRSVEVTNCSFSRRGGGWPQR